jgi:hypothetical protein
MSDIKAAFAFEEMFTVDELVVKWKYSEQTIRALFIDEPGVLKHGKASRKEGRTLKRQYYSLRIPAPVVERVYLRLAATR